MPSPPPEHNFDEIPIVEKRDDWWYRKYAEDEEGRPVPVAAGGADEPEPTSGTPAGIHMPDPSYWPILAAVMLPIMGWATVYRSWGILAAAGVGLIVTVFGWGLEPSAEEH